MEPIVIIGTGLAGYSTARELRKHDKSVPLLLISQDDGCNYYKPDLSEALSKGKTPEDLVKQTAVEMAQALQAEVRTHVVVHGIDAAMREIKVDGKSLRYSALVLANGAEPIAIPLAGEAASAVCQVNNFSDYVALRAQLHAARRVTVIGAGLIGCEFSNDLASQGIAVDCVDPVDWPLQRFLPRACGKAVAAELASAGVNWHFGHTVAAVHRDSDGLRVELDDGVPLRADLVLSAVGLRPVLALARTAGLKVAHGVVVDRELRTSNAHIYALGDCAEVDGLFRPFVAPLMQAARTLGRTLAGQPTRVRYPALPIIVKTPACPTVIYPPVAQGGGWLVEGEGCDLLARNTDTHGRLLGFALTGKATRQRGALIKSSLPMLD